MRCLNLKERFFFFSPSMNRIAVSCVTVKPKIKSNQICCATKHQKVKLNEYILKNQSKLSG